MKILYVTLYIAIAIAMLLPSACSKEDLNKALEETIEDTFGTDMKNIIGEWNGDYDKKVNGKIVKEYKGSIMVRKSDMKDELLIDMHDMPELRFKITSNKLGIAFLTADMSKHFLEGSAVYTRQLKSFSISLKISETEVLNFVASRRNE